MIIEAGYDILEILSARVNRTKKSRLALWVMCMDSDLRYLCTRRATKVMTGSIDSQVQRIARVLDSQYRPVAYFVLGHAVPEKLDRHDEWFYDADKRLQACPELAGRRLLGQVEFDPTGYYSSVPRYSFRDYVGLEDLPRTASVPGPHDYGCTCVACETFERMLAERRAQHQADAELGFSSTPSVE